MDRRPRSAPLRLSAGLAGALACRPPAGQAPEPAPSVLSQEPDSSTLSHEPRSAAKPPTPDAPPAPLDPELKTLLSEAYQPPPPPPGPAEARSPCHPDRPDTPYERSLCVCEAVCARTIDREKLARRMVEKTADFEAVDRWLREREPTTLHYPYTDTDGLRIDVGGDGRVTRCSHRVSGRPDSAVALECASLERR